MNGAKKEQITRVVKGEETNLPVVYTRKALGGSIVANAGRIILIATFDEKKDHIPSECYDSINRMSYYYLKSKWPVDLGLGKNGNFDESKLNAGKY